MKKNLYLSVFAFAASVALFVNCSPSPSVVGEKADALDASAWESAKWISAVDAPVVHDGNNGRAAVVAVMNDRGIHGGYPFGRLPSRRVESVGLLAHH